MPIGTWQYIDEEASIRHIGPPAQDFHALFAVGDQPTSIGTVDADGVALAAIQGLHLLLREKDAEVETQGNEISNLKNALRVLTREIDALKASLAAKASSR